MKHIFIVDDEENVRKIVEISMTKLGYKTSFARDGIEAINILNQENFSADLIILDVMIPGLTGFEISKRIKNNNKLKNIPIIMLTALAQDKDIERGFQAGVDAYIVKPFSVIELQNKVKSLLESSVNI